MISDEQLKAAVQATRKSLDMNQRDFADHIGMSFPMVQGLAGQLKAALQAKRFEAEVLEYQGEREPFSFW